MFVGSTSKFAFGIDNESQLTPAACSASSRSPEKKFGKESASKSGAPKFTEYLRQ